MRPLARKFKHFVLNLFYPSRKSGAELNFWESELLKYEKWHNGELAFLYNTPCPKDEEKIIRQNLRESSVLTWHKLHQEMKYLSDLELGRNVFDGRIVLDVGSGPLPSATCFSASELYCLDPLHPKYEASGYPYNCYPRNVHFVAGSSEKMPLKDAFFDVVISVNAIDHVDNIKKTAREIQRVLKPGGELRMHIHYHLSTITEPLAFNDLIISKLFSWCPNFKKISEHSRNHTGPISSEEKYVLWGNVAPNP